MTLGIGRDDIGFIIELGRGGGEKCLGTILQRLDGFCFALDFFIFFISVSIPSCAVVLTCDSAAAGV